VPALNSVRTELLIRRSRLSGMTLARHGGRGWFAELQTLHMPSTWRFSGKIRRPGSTCSMSPYHAILGEAFDTLHPNVRRAHEAPLTAEGTFDVVHGS
jgi:hypothetical protein